MPQRLLCCCSFSFFAATTVGPVLIVALNVCVLHLKPIAYLIIACGANWGVLLIQYTICDSTELEKMGSRVIVTEMLYCLESFVH